MSAAKLLISGLAGVGKTSLLQTLKDVLVIAHDGKKYPFPQPHVNIDDLPTITEFISLVNTKIMTYEEKFKVLPKTIVFDSVSKIFESIANHAARTNKGFDVWKEVNSEVYSFTDYIEKDLVGNGVNIVLVSHATWDVDTASYQLVAQGNFAKRGGFLAETDNAIFIEVKQGKRIVHHKTAKFACRSLLDIPDSQPVEDYNLQAHIDLLVNSKDKVASFIL